MEGDSSARGLKVNCGAEEGKHHFVSPAPGQISFAVGDAANPAAYHESPPNPRL